MVAVPSPTACSTVAAPEGAFSAQTPPARPFSHLGAPPPAPLSHEGTAPPPSPASRARSPPHLTSTGVECPPGVLANQARRRLVAPMGHDALGPPARGSPRAGHGQWRGGDALGACCFAGKLRSPAGPACATVAEAVDPHLIPTRMFTLIPAATGFGRHARGGCPGSGSGAGLPPDARATLWEVAERATGMTFGRKTPWAWRSTVAPLKIMLWTWVSGVALALRAL